MKKVVVRLDLHDDKDKQKAMKAASTVKGIDSIAMDMKEKKMTVIGDVDPIKIASKLRKIWHAEIVSVGPAKEPEKKEEPKKEEGPKKEEESKKEEPKKEEGKKEETKKEEEKKENTKKEEGEKKEPKKEEEKKKDPNEHVLELIKSYKAYNPHLTTHYHVQSVEENPNACIIS